MPPLGYPLCFLKNVSPFGTYIYEQRALFLIDSSYRAQHCLWNLKKSNFEKKNVENRFNFLLYVTPRVPKSFLNKF